MILFLVGVGVGVVLTGVVGLAVAAKFLGQMFEPFDPAR